MKIAQRYIYPPRPREGAIPHTELHTFQEMGWQGELKFNGNRLALHTNGADATFYNRHGEVNKTYTPPEWLLEEVDQVRAMLGLSKDEWNLFDGELLNNKHKLLKNMIALWDIIVRDSEWLLNTTVQERYNWILEQLPPDPEIFYLEIGGEKFPIGFKLTDHIFVPVMTEDLEYLWDLTQRINKAAGWTGEGEPVLEGVVLKMPSGKLEPGLKEKNNTAWQQRCRVKTGRHRY